tara:strand:+ start:844 stop:2097 length:1254 start_codon:yes stop_codon:yes gene_type:complete
MTKKAAVVGAGISGLYACWLLEKQGYSVYLYEKSDAIGGRMRSEKKSGFILDRGFHVLQTGYPLASEQFDYDAMGCQAFEPGALIIKPHEKNPKIWQFTDPFRRPIKGIFGAFSLFTSPLNLLRVGLLRIKLGRKEDSELFQKESQTTLDYLLSKGFSQPFIDRFFSPLFGGIFLETELRTDSRMFDFVFKNMSRGNMVLPKDGIMACPQQLFNRLTNTTLKLNANVSCIDSKTISDGNNVQDFDIVVRAFAPANSSPTRGVWTIHFAAPKSPLRGNYIMLNSSLKSSNSLISHLAVPSDIQPSYAPSDQSLITVTVVGEDATKQGLTSKQAIEESVIKELSLWFPGQVDEWSVLEVQYIESALPEFSGKHFDNLANLTGDNICGDSTYHASVEGALISAQRVIDNLVKNGPQDIGK